MGTSEQDKKRRRRRRTDLDDDEEDDDDDDDSPLDDTDVKQEDNDPDEVPPKASKRVGKRKARESGKSASNEPVPAKLFKRMTKLFEFVIKYRDKYSDPAHFILSHLHAGSSALSAKTIAC